MSWRTECQDFADDRRSGDPQANCWVLVSPTLWGAAPPPGTMWRIGLPLTTLEYEAVYTASG
jgi:hypothetical protein